MTDTTDPIRPDGGTADRPPQEAAAQGRGATERPPSDAGDGTGAVPRAEAVFETTPTIRPVFVWFAFATLVGGAILGYLLATPEALGERRLTEIVFWIVFLILAATLLRYAIKMFVLTRTQYIVTPDDIRREFSLLYRRNARELPVEKIRGIEFDQSRIQSLLGYGSLSFLAGGTNQSLGFVKFENLKDPHEARARIRELIAQRARASRGGD